ncbi:MAG: stage II sporulation protein M [Anaerolineae bacterium]
MKQHHADWERLTALVKRAQGGPLSGLSENELTELGRLYRLATSDLALAQRDFPNHALALYLNQLVGRAHPLIYRGEPIIWRQLKDFYLRGFPRLYREFSPFILAAALLFFGTAAISFAVMTLNPDAGSYLFSPYELRLFKDGQEWWRELNSMRNIGSTIIMTNNLSVAFTAFAGGITLGILTVYAMIMNGLSLGSILGLMQAYGHAGPLLEFVVGHGVLELSEITMAGGSGLMLGYAILHPGLLSRRDALITTAQKAVRLMLGSAPLLIVAGLIEGLLSPSNAPALIKVAVGLTSGVLLYSYLLLAGRKRKPTLRA